MPRIPLQETASYYWTPLCEILDLPQRTLERYQDLFYGRGLKFSSPLWGNTLPRAILFFAAQYPKNTANSAPCWKSHWSVFGHLWPPGNFKCLMRWPQTLYSHSTVDLTKKNRDEFLCPGYCVVCSHHSFSDAKFKLSFVIISKPSRKWCCYLFWENNAPLMFTKTLLNICDTHIPSV